MDSKPWLIVVRLARAVCVDNMQGKSQNLGSNGAKVLYGVLIIIVRILFDGYDSYED